MVAACTGDDDESGASGDRRRRGERSPKASTTAPRSRCGRAPRPRPSRRPLVDAYNASHENQVELTVIPTDDYQATRRHRRRRRASCPTSSPPTWCSSRNFTTAGAVPRHHRPHRRAAVRRRPRPVPHRGGHAATDKKYVVPHTIDLSVLLLQQGPLPAGRARPGEAADHPRASSPSTPAPIDALGGDVNGTFFGGNCGGCYVFTWWPSIWADGARGHERGRHRVAARRRPRRQTVYDICKGLFEDDIVAPGPATRPARPGSASSPKGNIGIMPMPSTLLGLMPEDLRDSASRPSRASTAASPRSSAATAIGISRQQREPGPGLELPRLDPARRGAGRGRSPRTTTSWPAPTSPSNKYSEPDPTAGDHQRLVAGRPHPVRAELRRRPSTTRRARGCRWSATPSSATGARLERGQRGGHRVTAERADATRRSEHASGRGSRQSRRRSPAVAVHPGPPRSRGHDQWRSEDAWPIRA